MNAKELRDQSDGVFSKRVTLLSLWQEQAENFYPERADFTFKRYLGDDFAGNLMSSYPILCHRDLSDQTGQMLRPTSKTWFNMSPVDQRREDHEAKQWLEWATGVQRRAMYDPASLFTKATREGDNDFSCFGQCVISVNLNRARDGLLYRCWHLRDVAWIENDEGKIGTIFRRWCPTAHTMDRLWGAKNHKSLAQKLKKDPFQEIQCLHIIVEADLYDGNAQGRPYWSIHFDVTHNHVIEEKPVWHKEYCIPRWLTVSGSQYAYSPATVAALPEARLLQSMTYTLLEAGEKSANPPMIATDQVVRSDLAVYAGGVTWVDMDYDEKMGEALRPISQDTRGLPFGAEQQRDSRAMIMQAFYLNKLNLPQRAPEMTAYEVGQRIQQYIRDALPLFEPMEAEYNGSICQETFDLLLRNRAFGSPFEMPRSLLGADIHFRFSSPLHEAIDEQKGQKFLQAKQLTAEALALDKTVGAIIDAPTAFRDALNGIGVPAKWTRSEVTVKQMQEQQRQQEEIAKTLQVMQAGADVAATTGGALKDMSQAMPAAA